VWACACVRVDVCGYACAARVCLALTHSMRAIPQGNAPPLLVGSRPAWVVDVRCSAVAVSRAGPSMMPGGTAEAYKYIEPIVTKV
jgi:hypothetical protein